MLVSSTCYFFKLPQCLQILLSFASGGLLGDAFLHLIPHAQVAVEVKEMTSFFPILLKGNYVHSGVSNEQRQQSANEHKRTLRFVNSLLILAESANNRVAPYLVRERIDLGEIRKCMV